MSITIERTPLESLREQVCDALHAILNERREELLKERDGADIIEELADDIGQVIDTYIPDEVFVGESDENTHLMILYCLEDPSLFTDQPEAVSCILEVTQKKSINARHVVYHNLYASLHDLLEHEIEEWYSEQQDTEEEK